MPVTGPFAHFPTPADSIRTKGTGLTDMVQPIETAEQAIAARHTTAGDSVLGSERYYDAGNLLVFVSDGGVQRAVSVLPDLLVGHVGHGYGTEVRLVPHGSGTPALLQLQEG